MSKKLVLCLSLLALPYVAGCSYEEGTVSSNSFLQQLKWPVSSEELIAAQGFSGFSGIKIAKLSSPEQKHADAKKRVSPDQTRGHLAYTDYIRRSDVMASSNFRSLSLEVVSDNGDESFAVASINEIKGSGGIPSPAQNPRLTASTSEHIQLASLDEEGRRKISHVSIPALPPKPSFSTLVAQTLQSDLKETAGLNVVNLRMGDYEDKTRLVLDLSAAAKFDYDLNNVNSLLTVHIDDAGWDLESQRYFDNHPLIRSYEVSRDKKNDVNLKIFLKHPSKMLMSGFVRPEGKRGYRIFFDVAAL